MSNRPARIPLTEVEGFPHFGEWTAIQCVGSQKVGTKPNGKDECVTMWVCECSCSKRRMVRESYLRHNKSRSCGNCTKKDKLTIHGHSDRKKGKTAYEKWNSAKRNAKQSNVPFHEPWKEYLTFLKDMGDLPSPDHHLCRKKLELGYVPGNLSWKKRWKLKEVEYKGGKGRTLSFARQLDVPASRAYRRVRGGHGIGAALIPERPEKLYLEYNGKKKSLKEWEEETGISADVMKGRIYRNWPVAKILTTPARQGKTLTYKGVTKTWSEWLKVQWVKDMGITYNHINTRSINGWSDERILGTQVKTRKRKEAS